jgi:hypothetical protein
MRFDPALAARQAFRQSEAELGSDWKTAVGLEDTFSSHAGTAAREAYEGLLALAQRHPNAHSFHAFCIYITWQQATEETIARHFQTGMRLCEAYLAARPSTCLGTARLSLDHARDSESIEGSNCEAQTERDVEQIEELYGSFRAGLGLDDEDEIQVEFRRDTPKGGD